MPEALTVHRNAAHRSGQSQASPEFGRVGSLYQPDAQQYGAGKTSSAPEILQGAVNIEAFVNADVIAQGLAGFDPQSAAVEAGRIMLRRLAELARQREEFAFESTLAGRSAHRFLFDLGL
jgi:hypothetical protein